MGWYGVSLCIKDRDWRALKEAVRFEAYPDRIIEVACRQIALDEGAGDPEEVKARARDLAERAQAGLRALAARVYG